MVDQKRTNEELSALALDRLRELRTRLTERHNTDVGLINEAIAKMEYVMLHPAPAKPKTDTKYVNVYEGGLGRELFDTKEQAARAARHHGYRAFGKYLETKGITVTITPNG